MGLREDQIDLTQLAGSSSLSSKHGHHTQTTTSLASNSKQYRAAFTTSPMMSCACLYSTLRSRLLPILSTQLTFPPSSRSSDSRHSFFAKQPHFGVSVFENAPIAAEANGAQERGARMRAVGVVVVPTPESGRCGQVWRHVEWLRREVRLVDVV
ncbi:hypothetical protein BC938DRAFT_483336 [Jimgerdemannia flammicorona]|uniref:Uncharacterized protein n=1 Tax=Jimgerdemannia flammicorona TaxID=994334 RepID=A0A433QC40_9FUNG|nr:hypothetical protein BC938DRAFT_483336 [Jimgerdemannia flammicorona]